MMLRCAQRWAVFGLQMALFGLVMANFAGMALRRGPRSQSSEPADADLI